MTDALRGCVRAYESALVEADLNPLTTIYILTLTLSPQPPPLKASLKGEHGAVGTPCVAYACSCAFTSSLDSAACLVKMPRAREGAACLLMCAPCMCRRRK